MAVAFCTKHKPNFLIAMDMYIFKNFSRAYETAYFLYILYSIPILDLFCEQYLAPKKYCYYYYSFWRVEDTLDTTVFM